MPNVNAHDNPAYWEALGRFTHAFAMVERHFTAAVMGLIDVNYGVSAAIVANRPISNLIEFTRTIFPKKRMQWGDENISDCMHVLKHMETITGIRNLIMHNGTLFNAPDNATVSRLLGNILAQGKNPQTVPLSTEILKSLTSDCDRISAYWFIHAWFSPPEAKSELTKWHAGLQKEWAYKKP
jgi:hypothetical protein